MEPEVAAALVAGSVSFFLAVANFAISRQQQKRVSELEERKFDLSRQAMAEKAELDYYYEARRRLYERFEPALFTLMERSEYALDRIENLTKPRTWAEFQLAEPGLLATANRPPMAESQYELTSTLYGLFAPLAIIRSMSYELTLIDLSLIPRIELQHFLCVLLYNSVKDDAALAGLEPVVQYDPFHPNWRQLRLEEPTCYWWQGLTMGRLESVLDLLTVELPTAGTRRLISFGEFERLYEDVLAAGPERDKKTLAVAANPLTDFHPDNRRVYWRLLMVQARLYQALLRTRSPEFEVPRTFSEWKSLVRLDNPEDFDWRVMTKAAPPLHETLSVGDNYFADILRRRLDGHIA